MKQLITRIDDELHRQFKVAAAKRGETMTQMIEEWIRQYVTAQQQAERGASQPAASFSAEKP